MSPSYPQMEQKYMRPFDMESLRETQSKFLEQLLGDRWARFSLSGGQASCTDPRTENARDRRRSFLPRIGGKFCPAVLEDWHRTKAGELQSRIRVRFLQQQ